MVKLYDLNKKGTIIITIGRSGSHLLGDIISNRLKTKEIAHVLHKENFWCYNQSISRIDSYYKQKIADMSTITEYQISQLQDFQIKVWLLTFNLEWLNDYHVIILKRNNNLKHFFSKQILENFHSTIPVHSFKSGVYDFDTGNFDSLKNQKIHISADCIFQFLSEKQLLNRFVGYETVVYEDMITWPDVANSIYEKNNYKIRFEDLFENHSEISTIFEKCQ